LFSSSLLPVFTLSPPPLLPNPAKDEGMKIPLLGEFLGVWPTRFWSAKCLAAGLGEDRNSNRSVKDDIVIIMVLLMDFSMTHLHLSWKYPTVHMEICFRLTLAAALYQYY
jgi:hypothetical protein